MEKCLLFHFNFFYSNLILDVFNFDVTIPIVIDCSSDVINFKILKSLTEVAILVNKDVCKLQIPVNESI